MPLSFPYTDGTLDGFFSKFYSLGATNVLFSTSIFPLHYDNYTVDKCFDRNLTSFCHTVLNDQNFLLIEFKSYPFLLSGYGFQHRHAEGHFPKKWVFEVSNDNVIYHSVHEVNDSDNTHCTIGLIRTFQVQLNKPFRYFRFSLTGPGCTNLQQFDLAEFELFGTLYPICICTVSRSYNHYFLLVLNSLLLIKI